MPDIAEPGLRALRHNTEGDNMASAGRSEAISPPCSEYTSILKYVIRKQKARADIPRACIAKAASAIPEPYCGEPVPKGYFPATAFERSGTDAKPARFIAYNEHPPSIGKLKRTLHRILNIPFRR